MSNRAWRDQWRPDFWNGALFPLGVDQPPTQVVGQSRHHLILQLEEIGHVLLEPVGPQMRARFGVDELRVDAHPVLIALHRAFEHIANAELLADLLGVDALALEGEGRVAGDDEAALDARKLGREVLGDAVGEIVLRRIAGEIGEGQHDDRKMRGLAGFARWPPSMVQLRRRPKRKAAMAAASETDQRLGARMPALGCCLVVAEGAGFAWAGWPTSSE